MLRSKIDSDPTVTPTENAAASADTGLANAVHLLHRAGQCADEVFTLKMAESAMTPRQFAVLKAVERSSNPSQNTLVELTGIDRSTTADIVRRLVERGFVQRRRTRHDARMYALKLTADGRAILRRADPVAHETDATLLAPLSTSEQQMFLSALNRIVEAIGPISSARVGRADMAKG